MDFKVTDWSAQQSHDHIICIIYKQWMQISNAFYATVTMDPPSPSIKLISLLVVSNRVDYSVFKKVPSSIHPWLPLQISPSWGSSPSPPPADKKKSATHREKH